MPTRDAPSRERRSLALGGEDVGYLLVRRRGRRGVGLQVDSDGLVVNAPLSIPVSRIEKMVADSERWVLKKLEVWRERRVPEQRWDDARRYLEAFLRRTLNGRAALASRLSSSLFRVGSAWSTSCKPSAERNPITRNTMPPLESSNVTVGMPFTL